jgi:hypothetical protein
MPNEPLLDPTKPEPLDPNKIFRECDGRDLFGYSSTELREKIKAGLIPKPFILAPPPSRAQGWYGWQINEYRAKVAAEQEAWAAAKTDAKRGDEDSRRYVPKGGDLTKKSEPADPEKPKVEKVKGLKRPARLPRRRAKG